MGFTTNWTEQRGSLQTVRCAEPGSGYGRTGPQQWLAACTFLQVMKEGRCGLQFAGSTSEAREGGPWIILAAMWGKAWSKGSKAGKHGKGTSKGADHSQDAWSGAPWSTTGKGAWTGTTGASDGYSPAGSHGYDAWTSAPGAAKGWEQSAGGKGKEQPNGKGQEWVPRLEGKYALAKTVLRPYADERWQAVYAQGSASDFFDKQHMRQIIDSRNSELARRPAIGVSVVSSSMLALAGLFEEDETEDDRKFQAALQHLHELFSGRDAAAFKKACEILSKDRNNSNSAEKRRKAVETWLAFFRANKEILQKSLPPVLQRTSLLYLGGMQALEASTLSNALGNWSSKIPTTVTNEASLSRWQASPKTLKLLVDYLVEAFGQRHADDAAWKRTYGGMGGDSDDEGGDKDADGLAWGLPAPIEKKRAKRDESSSTSSSKVRRKAARREKRRKQEKEAKATRTGRDRKEKKSKRTHLEEGAEKDATLDMDLDSAEGTKNEKSRPDSDISTSSSRRRRQKAAKREDKHEEKRKVRKADKPAGEDKREKVAEAPELDEGADEVRTDDTVEATAIKRIAKRV